MKIVVDGFGGDNSPLEIVKGVIDAVAENSDLEIIITGNEVKLNNLLIELNYQGNNISIINTTEIISNEESPTEAIRKKKDSSLVRAFNLLKDNKDIVGLISAGSTGAMLAGSIFIAKRIKGVSRPSLITLVPTVDGGVIALSDTGANADCKPINLAQFGLMGSVYLSAFCGVINPKVALLSNGSEEGKGNDIVKESYKIMKEMKNINFIGNIEARDILFGSADVITCDGFNGNIALKSSEGMAKAVFALLKQGISNGGLKGKIGALLLKPTLKSIKAKFDHEQQAGAIILGVEKIVVKAHGSSKALSIKNCINQVKVLAQKEIINKIKSQMEDLSIEE